MEKCFHRESIIASNYGIEIKRANFLEKNSNFRKKADFLEINFDF